MQITLTNINARTLEIERQRNEALTQCAVYAGQLAEADEHLKHLQQMVTELEQKLEALASPRNERAV